MSADYTRYQIKSYKHNGHIHRIWSENWLVPEQYLLPEHAAEGMIILLNDQTPIIEANGGRWVSRVPGVSFFVPGCWFNIVALVETNGVRFYCNVASPPYHDKAGQAITYIDYDLDVIRTTDGKVVIVDEDEYEAHKKLYKYSEVVEGKARNGLQDILQRIRSLKAPFDEGSVQHYYEEWRNWQGDRR